MNLPTPLPRTLALLLVSLCIGLPSFSLAKEKKQAALQCEQGGTLGACPDAPAAGNTSQPTSFKAQSDDPMQAPEKKKKGRKSEGKKKSKRSKSAEE
jgi:hypothetical protein